MASATTHGESPMNLRLLIDGIVRQTTVLIAQLSTASGSRAPLARISDEVFLSLAREIEAQGVRKQVVADMFGLAMRSYQKKMARLAESASSRDRTLWEAMFEFIADQRPTRARLLERFAYDGERDVSAVLNDLVRSGLVFTTGGGDSAVFGVTPNDVLRSVQREYDRESIENWVWLVVFRGEAHTESSIVDVTRCEPAAVEDAVARLIAHGRLAREGERLRASNVVLPIGSERGWESAVLDHFRTVAVAIAQKVRLGVEPAAKPNDEIGGSTFTFTVTPEHPYDQLVRRLLSRHRQEVQALWDSVAEYNRLNPPDPEKAQRISFYVGQLVEGTSDREDISVQEDQT